MRRSPDDVVRRLAFTFQKQIGFADRVSLRVNILTVKMSGDFLPVLSGELLERFLADREHSTGTASAVVKQVRPRFDLIGDWQKSFAISLTASRGVQCSPASSLFSSLKRRTSSSKIVPIAWLSRARCFCDPSLFRTGLGL